MPSPDRIRLAEHLDDLAHAVSAARAELAEATTSADLYEVLAHLEHANADSTEALDVARSLYRASGGLA